MQMQRARSTPDVMALEAQLERAGDALACSFSSSAEFEAAIIKARREAGIYGPKRQRRQFLKVAAPATLVVFAIVLAAAWIS
jgi:hypothetical protein